MILSKIEFIFSNYNLGLDKMILFNELTSDETKRFIEENNYDYRIYKEIIIKTFNEYGKSSKSFDDIFMD